MSVQGPFAAFVDTVGSRILDQVQAELQRNEHLVEARAISREAAEILRRADESDEVAF